MCCSNILANEITNCNDDFISCSPQILVIQDDKVYFDKKYYGELISFENDKLIVKRISKNRHLNGRIETFEINSENENKNQQ